MAFVYFYTRNKTCKRAKRKASYTNVGIHLSDCMKIIILLILLSIFHIVTFKRIWTSRKLNKSQKWINTILCLLLPILWNSISLLIVPKKKELKIMTKSKRKTKNGTSGDSLGDYTNAG